MADARFEHVDAGLHEPIMDLPLQLVGDLDGIAAQRLLAVPVRVVGVLRREVAQRGLRLNVHEVLEVVDLENRLERVHHPPDDDGGDLDRIPVGVVDLEMGGLEVPHPERDRLLAEERVRPAQAGVALGAAIGPEQVEDASLIRFDHEKAAQGDEGQRSAHRSERDLRDLATPDAAHEKPEASAGRQEKKQKSHQSVRRRCCFLSHTPSKIAR